MKRRTVDEVIRADTATIGALEKARDKIAFALTLMPNDVRSTFVPADAARLDDALRMVNTTLMVPSPEAREAQARAVERS